MFNCKSKLSLSFHNYSDKVDISKIVDLMNVMGIFISARYEYNRITSH